MSGTPKIKPPKNDAEWARGIQKRVEGVENPTSQRMGSWVISEDPTSGNLIASHVNGGSVTLAQAPNATDNPDVVSTGLPYLIARRITAQSTSASTWTVIQFESVDSISGSWNASNAGFTSVRVPKDGLYAVWLKVEWTTNADRNRYGGIRVNGVITDLAPNYTSVVSPGHGGPSNLIRFTAGDLVEGMAYQDYGTLNFGQSGQAGVTSFTTLALICLQ